MWWKVFADGTEVDIVVAHNAEVAINEVQNRFVNNGHGIDGIHWTAKLY
jgi:hypothetical protein